MKDRIWIEARVIAQDDLYFYTREGGATVAYSKRWYWK